MNIEKIKDICNQHGVALAIFSFDELHVGYCGEKSILERIAPVMRAVGFSNAYISNEKLDELIENAFLETVKTVFRNTTPGYHIFITKEFAENLSDESIEALVWSELGYIHHNESIRQREMDPLYVSTRSIDIPSKSQGDDYSVLKNGVTSLLKAFEELPEASASLFRQGGRFEGMANPDDIRTHVAESIRERAERLLA